MKKNEDLETEKEETKDISNFIALLFSSYKEYKYELNGYARIFKYLAKRIDCKKRKILADIQILMSFESVYLAMCEVIKLYPPELKLQINEIVQRKKILQIIAYVANTSEDDNSFIKQNKSILNIFNIFPQYGKSIEIEKGENIRLTSSRLFNLKIALNRIAQILQYASTIKVAASDDTIDNFRDHYNPDLIDKNKVIALINLLKVQISQMPESFDNTRLENRIEQLENEIRNPKCNWSSIIATCFILFGFVADLKSLSPSIYDGVYSTVNQIIMVIHNDGQSSNENNRLRISDDNEKREVQKLY